MALNIRFDTTDITRVRDKAMRIRDNIQALNKKGSKMVATTIAKSVQSAAKFKNARGTLLASIKPVPTNEGYGVAGAYYAWYADLGRGPGRRPPAGPYGKLTRWAGSKLGGKKLSKYIGAHGTHPTFFIRDGMIRARPIWRERLRQHTEYYLKSGGRTL